MNPLIIEKLGKLTPAKIKKLLGTLTPEEAKLLMEDKSLWDLPYQRLPPGDWRRWLLRAGRGAGKTYTGSRVTNIVARDRKKIRTGEIAIISRTYSDVRKTCVESSVGILATADPDFKPIYEPGKGLLTWPNGVRGRLLSGDKPDGGRGLNASWVWADEINFWPDPEKAWWEVIEPALRIGWARAMITTTPVPDPFLKNLEALSDTVVRHATMFDNPYLDAKTRNALKERYDGTRIGLQELYGEYLNDDDRLLWNQDVIHQCRLKRVPSDLQRIVVAIDPAAKDKATSDATGIVVAGVDNSGHGYVLEDLTMKGKPHQWALVAIKAYRKWGADRIVAEVNNGGDMVEATIRAVDSKVSYEAVHASRGKMIRAEPVAALYERLLVHHVGLFDLLEREMTTWLPGKKSPNRMDALVWALTNLMLPKEKKVGPLAAYL